MIGKSLCIDRLVTSKTRVEGGCGLWELAYLTGWSSTVNDFWGKVRTGRFFWNGTLSLTHISSTLDNGAHCLILKKYKILASVFIKGSKSAWISPDIASKCPS